MFAEKIEFLYKYYSEIYEGCIISEIRNCGPENFKNMLIDSKKDIPTLKFYNDWDQTTKANCHFLIDTIPAEDVIWLIEQGADIDLYCPGLQNVSASEAYSKYHIRNDLSLPDKSMKAVMSDLKLINYFCTTSLRYLKYDPETDDPIYTNSIYLLEYCTSNLDIFSIACAINITKFILVVFQYSDKIKEFIDSTEKNELRSHLIGAAVRSINRQINLSGECPIYTSDFNDFVAPRQYKYILRSSAIPPAIISNISLLVARYKQNPDEHIAAHIMGHIWVNRYTYHIYIRLFHCHGIVPEFLFSSYKSSNDMDHLLYYFPQAYDNTMELRISSFNSSLSLLDYVDFADLDRLLQIKIGCMFPEKLLEKFPKLTNLEYSNVYSTIKKISPHILLQNSFNMYVGIRQSKLILTHVLPEEFKKYEQAMLLICTSLPVYFPILRNMEFKERNQRGEFVKKKLMHSARLKDIVCEAIPACEPYFEVSQ